MPDEVSRLERPPDRSARVTVVHQKVNSLNNRYDPDLPQLAGGGKGEEGNDDEEESDDDWEEDHVDEEEGDNDGYENADDGGRQESKFFALSWMFL
jgi:hypothetical protein